MCLANIRLLPQCALRQSARAGGGSPPLGYALGRSSGAESPQRDAGIGEGALRDISQEAEGRPSRARGLSVTPLRDISRSAHGRRSPGAALCVPRLHPGLGLPADAPRAPYASAPTPYYIYEGLSGGERLGELDKAGEGLAVARRGGDLQLLLQEVIAELGAAGVLRNVEVDASRDGAQLLGAVVLLT